MAQNVRGFSGNFLGDFGRNRMQGIQCFGDGINPFNHQQQAEAISGFLLL